jgi:arylsulfatase A-like enzyme
MKLLPAALAAVLVASPAWARPNFVVILTDDQATGSMAYMPKVQELIAEQGVTFNNSLVNVPLCAPSRASFMTGQAAHNHGITSNRPETGGGWQEFRNRENSVLAVWLKKAGFTTAFLGKYLNGYGVKDTRKSENADTRNEQQSLDVMALLRSYLGFASGGQKKKNPNRNWVPEGWDFWFAFTGRDGYYNYPINENGTVHTYGDQASDYSTDVLKARAVRFIEAQSHSTKPFFVLIAPKTPHGETQEGKAEYAAIPSPQYKNLFTDVEIPTTPASDRRHSSAKPSGLNKDTLKKEYQAALQSLQSVDDLVQAIVGALDKADLLNNTIIIYTSDNGFIFGEHGLRGKLVPFEGSIKVPLLMRGPGIPKDRTFNQLVSNLDVVATIIDLAGASPDVTLDGRSLAPLMADANVAWRKALLIEHAGFFAGVRTETKKYVVHSNGNEELYDLAADPYEIQNKIGDKREASELAALRSILNNVQTCKGTACWVP